MSKLLCTAIWYDGDQGKKKRRLAFDNLSLWVRCVKVTKSYRRGKCESVTRMQVECALLIETLLPTWLNITFSCLDSYFIDSQ